MTPEELEHLTTHLREQMTMAGMPAQQIEESALRVLAYYIHQSRTAMTPTHYVMVYRAIYWCLQHAKFEL
jgi:hypothetical protein